ncbi:MAG TPA: hypothetical protein ENH29_04650 [Bacteroidetes bacterium]|nr:hypothetical protein [Bacteroidota bacterium]
MKTSKKFVDWMIERDKHIMDAHLKKGKNLLEIEYQLMKKEMNRLRNYLHRLESLIERQEDLNSVLPESQKGDNHHVD